MAYANVGPAYYNEQGMLVVTGAVDPFYDYGQTSFAPTASPVAAAPQPGGETTVEVDRLPEPLKTAAIAFLGPLNAVRVVWNNLPDWLRAGLVALGIVAAVIVLLRVAGPVVAGLAVRAVAGGFGGRNRGGPEGLHGQARRTWLNGAMAAFFDGYLGAKRKDGSWTYWKPKKPLTLYPGAKMDLAKFAALDKIMDREAKRLRKILARRLGMTSGGKGRRGSSGLVQVIETGPGGVRMLPKGS